MNHDEITAKLREYEEAGGDDAVLPAVLRVLIESNRQHADALAKSQKAMNEKCAAIQKEQEALAEALLESNQRHAGELTESQKAHAKAALESHRKLSDKLTKSQGSMTERFAAIQKEQKSHAETVQTRINVAITLALVGAIAALASVLLS